MKNIFVLLLVGISLLSSGCALTNAPVNGWIYNGTKGPVAATGSTSYTKTGEADCHAINFYFSIGWGNCTVQAAKNDGRITKVSMVDSESFEILNIYGQYTLVVYGD